MSVMGWREGIIKILPQQSRYDYRFKIIYTMKGESVNILWWQTLWTRDKIIGVCRGLGVNSSLPLGMLFNLLGPQFPHL